MRILVTGGAGFVGSHVAEGLVAQGHEVVVVGVAREEGPNRVPDGAAFEQVSVTDREGIERAFATWKPEVVSHHAAVANVTRSVRDPLHDAEVNVMGSLDTAKTIRTDLAPKLATLPASARAAYLIASARIEAADGKPAEERKLLEQAAALNADAQSVAEAKMLMGAVKG